MRPGMTYNYLFYKELIMLPVLCVTIGEKMYTISYSYVNYRHRKII